MSVLLADAQAPDQLGITVTVLALEVIEEAPSLTDEFRRLRTAPEMAAERRQLDHWLAAAPDKILAPVAEMDDPTAAQPGTGPTVYAIWSSSSFLGVL